jgi:hypothetical protein
MTYIVCDTDTAFDYARPRIEQHTNSVIQHADYLRIYDAQNHYHLKGLALGIICKNGDAFYLKYSEKWRIAGYETRQFLGPGMAVNLEHYTGFITETHADILFYEKVEKKLYYCPYKTFVENSFEHVQKWDGQPVQVIQFDNYNKFFQRWD